MKTKLLLFNVLFLFTIGNAQNMESSAKIEYDMMLNLSSIQNYKAVLLYNNNVSLFTYTNLEKKDVEVTDEKGNSNIFIADTLPKVLYTEKTNNTIYELLSSQSNAKNSKIVYEATPTINWLLLEETKKIGSFICNKATATFRGRNYTAWYSLDVKGGFGPWKLQGLPGVILEAYDEKREVVFTLKKIEIPKKEKITFDKTKFKNILYETHKKDFVKKMEAMQSEIQAGRERGDNFTFKFKISGIEKE
jgi:GLPGLI family protein